MAEFDNQLENYFVETQPFLELVRGNKDIVAGDKGTGKTALFRILHKRYAQLPALRNIVVIPAFNPTGNPIFQQLAEREIIPEGEYTKLWKAFALSLVGNWLLKHNKIRPKSNLQKLDQLLRGLNLRSDTDAPLPVFQKILDSIGNLFKWQSAEIEFSSSADGFSFTPKVDFDGKKDDPKTVSIDSALRLLQECLFDANKTVWLALDRLDEAFQGYPDVEIPALRALFRTYLDMIEYDNIKIKLFVRRDLFSRIVEGGFVNLTHLNARKVEIIWDEEDLLNLLSRRVRQNPEFMNTTHLKSAGDKDLFYKLFPTQVDQGTRKPDTWVWIMGRIKDGNNIKPPRNLIDLVSFAQNAQLRREEREPRDFERGKPIFEADSLRKALQDLSATRVNDTLLAEAKSQAPLINKFRGGKAEHNEESIAHLLEIFPSTTREYIKPLIALGFLEETGGNYKIPMLYRSGLNITQGKAFENREHIAAEEDDE